MSKDGLPDNGGRAERELGFRRFGNFDSLGDQKEIAIRIPNCNLNSEIENRGGSWHSNIGPRGGPIGPWVSPLICELGHVTQNFSRQIDFTAIATT